MERDIGRGAEVLSAKSPGSSKCCAVYPEYGACFMSRVYSLKCSGGPQIFTVPLSIFLFVWARHYILSVLPVSGFHLHISNFLCVWYSISFALILSGEVWAHFVQFPAALPSKILIVLTSSLLWDVSVYWWPPTFRDNLSASSSRRKSEIPQLFFSSRLKHS